MPSWCSDVFLTPRRRCPWHAMFHLERLLLPVTFSWPQVRSFSLTQGIHAVTGTGAFSSSLYLKPTSPPLQSPPPGLCVFGLHPLGVVSLEVLSAVLLEPLRGSPPSRTRPGTRHSVSEAPAGRPHCWEPLTLSADYTALCTRPLGFCPPSPASPCSLYEWAGQATITFLTLGPRGGLRRPSYLLCQLSATAPLYNPQCLTLGTEPQAPPGKRSRSVVFVSEFPARSPRVWPMAGTQSISAEWRLKPTSSHGDHTSPETTHYRDRVLWIANKHLVQNAAQQVWLSSLNDC